MNFKVMWLRAKRKAHKSYQNPTNKKEQKIRVYPLCCQSMYCGRIECTGCSNEPVLKEFKKWAKDTSAIVEDPIWSPSVWTARSD